MLPVAVNLRLLRVACTASHLSKPMANATSPANCFQHIFPPAFCNMSWTTSRNAQDQRNARNVHKHSLSGSDDLRLSTSNPHRFNTSRHQWTFSYIFLLLSRVCTVYYGSIIEPKCLIRHFCNNSMWDYLIGIILCTFSYYSRVYGIYIILCTFSYRPYLMYIIL